MSTVSCLPRLTARVATAQSRAKHLIRAWPLFVFLFVGAADLGAQTTVTFTSSGTWTAPAGVTSATVEAWGGGGAGGGATGNPAKGGGGAGGQYARKVVTVVPGNNYAVVIGAGGIGGTGNGPAGGDSTFAATTVVAKGGAGASVCSTNNCTALGGVGSTAGGVGDTVYAGGSGSNGSGATGIGGAGGGGAGSTGAGGSASGNTAGTGTAVGGGDGAAARTTGGACTNPAGAAGGGGCGGYATSPADRSGGNGARGEVRITYTQILPPTATTNAASGITPYVATLNGTVSSNGAQTAVSFEYGLTAAYGNTITANESPLASNATNATVTAPLEGLACNTTFHYRVVASNSQGTTYGLDSALTTAACAAPFPPTSCAAERFGSDLGCTANDVNITAITLAAGNPSCVSGTPVTLDLNLELNFASPDRWDIGIFIANDGKLPTVLPANGGAGSCSVEVLPISLPPNGDAFLDLDGAPQGTADTCGDGNSAFVPLPPTPIGSGIKRMTGVTLPCFATAASGGNLFVPFVVSWDNQKSPIGGVCTSNQYPVPNTTSKCNAPASTVSIPVVVLPKISKTHTGTTFNPGDNITYTVTIFNDSGGTLQAMFFRDPAILKLTVNNVTCSAAAGASCPAVSVADMQGSPGIAIPSANLPNNSTLTFTLDATIASLPTAQVGDVLSNVASVSIGGNTNTATDAITLGAPSASKSFAPSTITEGNSSVLTVTFTNPTASPVTGVSFTDTYPAGLVNTASASGTTTCGGTVTAANNGNSVELAGGTIPASGSCTVTVNVTSATAGNYINNTGTISRDGPPTTISAASATLTVNAGVFGAFNACDVAAAPNASCTNTTTATTSHIKTKVAGSAFSLDLVALKTDGTRNTNYSHTVLVELLDASNNSGALDAYNCRSTWTVIATLSPNPAFTNPDNGLITVGPFTIAEAYRDVRVRVSNVGGATRIGCSTDNFAIRPHSFVNLTVTDGNWQTAGAARALTNVSANGGNVHKAGQPFTLQATAVNAVSATTTYYTGTPGAALATCVGTGCTATFGSFNLNSSTALGVVSSSTATYAEVGSFTLQLQDQTFASVDAADGTPADCGNPPSTIGQWVCSAALDVGRFVPDHFDLAVKTAPVFKTFNAADSSCTPPSRSFTYIGQPFGYVTPPEVNVFARNAAGATTTKYSGDDLWKLGGTGAAPSPSKDCTTDPNVCRFTTTWTAAAKNAAVIESYAYALTPASTPGWDNSASATAAAIETPGAGTGTIAISSSTLLAFLRNTTTPQVPFTANIANTVSVQDASENGVAGNGIITTTTPLVFNGGGGGIAFDAGNQFRYGILKLDNAYGSELLPIRAPLRAMYWNGGATPIFVTNTEDNCTPLSTTNLAIGNYMLPLAALATCGFAPATAPYTGTCKGTYSSSTTLSGGSATLVMSSAGVTGSADIAFNLTNTNADVSCNTTHPATTGRNIPWLEGKWGGSTACPSTLYDRDPNARVRFGSSRSPVIYLREMY